MTFNSDNLDYFIGINKNELFRTLEKQHFSYFTPKNYNVKTTQTAHTLYLDRLRGL